MAMDLSACMPGALRGQRKVPDPFEQKLQLVVIHNMGAGDWAPVL